MHMPRMNRSTRRRAGFTLLEVMVVIAIIVALVGIVAFGSHAVRNAMKKSSAVQQMKIIDNAIQQYAEFWPAWKYPGNVLVADRGWPDFIAGRLFPIQNYGPFSGQFSNENGFNDGNHVTFTLDEGTQSGVTYDPGSGDMNIAEGDVEFTAECLMYALTAPVGKGPYIKDEMQGNLQVHHDDEMYPRLGAGGSVARGEFVDPWGTPYRYFWVHSDASLPSQNGYLPVTTSDPTDTANFRKATGYILESAGPDRRYGDLWRSPATQKQIKDAEDNLILGAVVKQ